MERRISRSAIALGLVLAACQAQATPNYMGEPLLSLSGHVTVNALTDGQPITPALCFIHQRSGQVQLGGAHQPFPTEHVPPEVLADFDPERLTYDVNTQLTIVDVDSVGQFPADFDVAAYLPPPDSVLRPEFTGEPRRASGHVCAVRGEHPSVVTTPSLVSIKHCDSGDDGPCRVRYLWATRETKRYYTELYECPSVDSELQDCLLTTAGDAGLRRELFEYVVGFDALDIVYLAEEAPAGGYTAWMYGSSDALSPGFRLFTPQSNVLALSADDPQRRCWNDSITHGYAELYEAFPDHNVFGFVAGVSTIELAYADAAFDFQKQRMARYRMEHCDLPNVQALSPDEELSITINREFPLLGTLTAPRAPANEASH